MGVEETKLKITADDRDLKKLAQTIPQAFDKKVIKEFHRAGKDLEGQLTNLVRKQADLTREMLGVKRGTDAYKSFGKELRAVRREADMVGKSLGQVEKITRRQEAERRRGQGFGAGVAQGLGVSEYIPSGPGMGRRIGGAMLGRGARRAGGIASAPFAMPGIGGVAQGLAGVPVVGGFLSGALQQASGAYQAAVGYEQSRLQNLAYAGPRMGSVVGKERFNEATAAASSARKAFARSLQRNEAPAATGVHDTPTGGPQAHKPGDGRGYDPLTDKPLMRAARKQTKAQLDNQMTLAARVDTAMAAERLAKSGVRRISGLGSIGMGTQFGMQPEATQQALGGFFGARGGLFRQGGGSAAQFQEAMAAQTRRGISMQQSGAFARMGGVGGGGTGGMDLSTLLANAMKSGLEGSQLSEYLATLVGLGQQAEKMGVKINVREFVKGERSLQGMGIGGLQAQRISGGLQKSAMGLSGRGVSGPLDVIMARAAGFDPSQGSEGYAKAMNKLAGGMTSEMMNNMIGMVVQGTSGGGFGPEMQRMMVRRAMSKLGAPIGPGQATALIEAKKAGRTLSTADLVPGTTMYKGRRMSHAQAAVAEAKAGVRAVAPTAIGAAGLAVGRIGVGQAAAEWVQAFERNAQKSGMVINQFSKDLLALSKVTGKFMDMLKTFTEGGIGGITKKGVGAWLNGVGL